MSRAGAARPIARSRQPWVTTVTTDAIRHFAWGIGDSNPLWGVAMAPPCFLYAVDETTVAPGHPDRRRVYSAVDWIFFDVITVGSNIEVTAELVDETNQGDDIEQTGCVSFRTHKGALVATANTSCLRRMDALTAVDDRAEIRYTGEQLAAIEHTILSEQRRGDSSRLYEDVEVGEEMGPLLKGPLSIMDVVAWSAATSGAPNDEDDVSEGGLRAETATGPELVSWMAQLVTDWMGDDGFLHQLSLGLAECPPLGTTTSIRGQVTEVTSCRGRSAVIVNLNAQNQDDQTLAHGNATILLPSKAKGAVKLPVE
jgi:hypothetical protein